MKSLNKNVLDNNSVLEDANTQENENAGKKKLWNWKMIGMLTILLVGSMALPVYAAPDTSAVTTKFSNLQAVVATIISGLGTIIALWGIGEFGMAQQGNDGAMSSHSFKRIGGGMVMVLAPQILIMLN